MTRAAESESRPELESVGVDRFGWSVVGAVVGKFGRLRLRPGVPGYLQSTDDDLGRTVIHRLENVERQEEKKSVSVEIKLKRRLVIKFGLEKKWYGI